MHEGVVLVVKLAKGFGFIGEPNAPDLFFHKEDCLLPWDEQLEGRRVKFAVITTPKGNRAKAVQAAD